MNILYKLLLIGAVLIVSACSNSNLFGRGADGSDLISGAGDVSDPRSPAYFQQTVGDRVLFVVDQSTLTTEGRAILDAQADWLNTNTEFNALIEGHADEQGTRDYNLALGGRRANAVQEYLVSRGVAETRLRIVSFGKERPIEICSEEACYAKNRRAVTVVSAGPVS
ncbi:MAG: peptidoglycan-associated lipoprotein Pal [Pseudomonadota bacterium]